MSHHDWSEIRKPVDVLKLFQVTKCHDNNEEFQKNFTNASGQRSIGWCDIDKTVYLGKNDLNNTQTMLNSKPAVRAWKI